MKYEALSKNPEKPNKISKLQSHLKKLVGVGVLGATLLTPTKAKGQEVPQPPETSASETYEEEEQQIPQEASPDIDREEYWLNLFTVEAFRRFPEYANKDFAQHVLEQHIEKSEDPSFLFNNIQYLKTYIGYKDILRQAVDKVLADDFYYHYLLHESSIDLYKELDNYKQILEEAAQKTVSQKNNFGQDESEQVLSNAETLFKHLTKTSAEYFLRKAVSNMVDGSPWGWDILRHSKEIKKYLSDADSILWIAAEKGIKYDANRFFFEFFLKIQKDENVFSDERRKELLNNIVEEDPEAFLSHFSDKESYWAEQITETSPYIADYLKSIAASDMNEKEKDKAAALIDAMLFDKHLTLEEMKATINDPVRAQKLALEIRSRKNYIGRQSLNRQFPAPKEENN
jgi:hypothetical protein